MWLKLNTFPPSNMLNRGLMNKKSTFKNSENKKRKKSKLQRRFSLKSKPLEPTEQDRQQWVYFAFKLCPMLPGVNGETSRGLRQPQRKLFCLLPEAQPGRPSSVELDCSPDGDRQQEEPEAILHSGWQIIKGKTDSRDSKGSRDTASEAK